MNPTFRAGGHRGPMLLPYAIVALALLVGLYARFKGLGAASMAADEYYLARSVQNVLRFGIPEFDCGGYYPRALAFQYLVAGLAALGLDPASGARWVAAISSVIALPAVYLLGRRAGGKPVALAALAILAVSIWEVELARFGRMYAPFQAVFLWYLVFVAKLAVDAEKRAMWPLLALTVLGALTWEGGAFLALANLMLIFVRNPRGKIGLSEVLFAAVSAALFLAAYAVLSANLRLAGNEPQFPADFDLEAAREVAALARGRVPPMWSTLSAQTLWVVLWIIPIALALNALRWVWTLRQRWPAALALALGLALVAIHQFGALVVLVLLLLLMGLLRTEDLRAVGARHYGLAVVVAGLFWLAFGLSTGWRSGTDTHWLGNSRLVGVLYEFIRMPDLLRQIVRPWVGAVPWLASGVAVLAAAALVAVLRNEQRWDAQRIFLTVLIFMAAAVGLTSPPREETRYVFFLFPLAIIVALTPVVSWVEAAGARRGIRVAGLGALVAFGLYALTEDFQLRHLLAIDRPAALLRTDLSYRLESHVVPRTDVRGAAQWLAAASRDSRALRVSAYPSADYYFADFDFAYLDREGRRFRAYSCSRGTKERWGGLPLIYSMPDLSAKIALAGGAYIVANAEDSALFAKQLAQWKPRVAWRAADGEIEVLALGAAGGAEADGSVGGGAG